MNARKPLSLLPAILLAVLLGACVPAAAEAPVVEPPPETQPPGDPEGNPDAEPLRVALVLPGRSDDVSWNQAVLDGMNRAIEQTDVPVDLTVVEQVYDPVDIEPALIDYAQQGYDLIVGPGFQFQEPIIKVAPDYPGTNFAAGSGFKLAPNVSVYDVRLEQGGYVMGILAGLSTESDVVGAVGGVDVSEIHRGHVGFILGAESVNPDVTVLTTFVGDFNDLNGAKNATLRHIDAGADRLWQTGDGVGLAVLSACAEADVICMGNVANQTELAPEHVLASFVYDWSIVYRQMIEETAAGTFGGKAYWIDFANDGVAVEYNEALMPAVTEEMQAAVEEAVQGFRDGTLDLGDLDAYRLEGN